MESKKTATDDYNAGSAIVICETLSTVARVVVDDIVHCRIDGDGRCFGLNDVDIDNDKRNAQPKGGGPPLFSHPFGVDVVAVLLLWCADDECSGELFGFF